MLFFNSLQSWQPTRSNPWSPFLNSGFCHISDLLVEQHDWVYAATFGKTQKLFLTAVKPHLYWCILRYQNPSLRLQGLLSNALFMCKRVNQSLPFLSKHTRLRVVFSLSADSVKPFPTHDQTWHPCGACFLCDICCPFWFHCLVVLYTVRHMFLCMCVQKKSRPVGCQLDNRDLLQALVRMFPSRFVCL